MLPFLKKQDEGAVSAPIRTEEITPRHDQGDHLAEFCMSELIECVHAKDPVGALEAFRALFEVMESEPHTEAAE